MKLMKKTFLLSFLGIISISLSSCSWDTITRAQAKQILESIQLYRGENVDSSDPDRKPYKFEFPRDKTNSVTFRRQYSNKALYSNKQVQEYLKVVASPVNPGHEEDQVLYIKQYKGVGREYLEYFEAYYYVENNVFYSKEKIDGNNDNWVCEEVREYNLIDAYFVSKRTELINIASKVVEQYNKTQPYIDLLDSIATPENNESNHDANVIVSERYESYGHHSISADITFYDVLLSGRKQMTSWYSFAFNDIYLNHFYNIDYVSETKGETHLDINYDAYISIPSIDFNCGEENNESESILESN